MRRLRVVPALVATLVLTSCGYELVRYRDALGDTRRVAIHGLRNDTFEPGLDSLVTDALAREFLRRGALRLVEDPGQADLVITGSVGSLVTHTRSFSSIRFVVEYQVTMKLELEVQERDGSTLPIGRGALAESELYLASADVEAARKNREEALRRVATILAGRLHDALYERLAP